MKIEIMFFGIIAEMIGAPKLEITNCYDTETLNKQLIEKYPKLKNMKYVIAVYKELITSNTTLKNGDKVALLPPFAGG
ncbi:MAG: MoaD/ThiS family protein [Bacteroidia bacterium]|nr:MoaD/ThiS family protein [Bacteroidia bacterium]